MRIKQHPILGKLEPRKIVKIEVDNKAMDAFEGEPIAAALIANGINVFRYTKKYKQPRGIFCAIGLCTDCIMMVDGVAVRTCVTGVEEGMKIKTMHKT